MKSLKLFIPLVTCVVFIFTSCHKKETVEVDNETQSVVDNAVAEQEFMAIVPATNGMAIKTKGTGAEANRSTAVLACDSMYLVKGTGAGDTLWDSPTHVPPTYSLSFSDPNCSPIPDAKIRAGELLVTFFGRVKRVNSRMKFIMQNYKAANSDPNKLISYICDSIVVKTISNDSINHIRVFNVKIYNGKCIGGSGSSSWTTLYSTDRYIKHYENTGDIQIWGSSNGTNRLGRTFTVTVDQTTPLTKHTTCQFISSGIVKLTPNGFKERTVDYASGTGGDACDEDATFSVNGNTVAFKLK